MAAPSIDYYDTGSTKIIRVWRDRKCYLLVSQVISELLPSTSRKTIQTIINRNSNLFQKTYLETKERELIKSKGWYKMKSGGAKGQPLLLPLEQIEDLIHKTTKKQSENDFAQKLLLEIKQKVYEEDGYWNNDESVLIESKKRKYHFLEGKNIFSSNRIRFSD